MRQMVTMRLTPERERLLKLFKSRFNIATNSEAIELALKMSFKEEINYKSKIEAVSGCLKSKSRTNAVKTIRSLRD